MTTSPVCSARSSGANSPRRASSTATIDPALEAVCLKAMTFAPEERYATSRALADDIERWTAGQPVSAWHEPWHAGHGGGRAAARRCVARSRRSARGRARRAPPIFATCKRGPSADVERGRASARRNSSTWRWTPSKSFHSTVDEHPLLGRQQFDDLADQARD